MTLHKIFSWVEMIEIHGTLTAHGLLPILYILYMNMVNTVNSLQVYSDYRGNE